ncbi:MAG: hypothetical protein FVQ80_00020 [Planctomycetes bacterium]|nr:hypothetical protein [Planctomycetota bacterium]
MSVLLRKKLTIITLIIYWVFLAIISHIPIPELVYQARVSDKNLHLVAYMILVFLLWFSLRPEQKVNWRKITVWWVILIIGVYAVMDEVIQGVVGRNCDMMDFIADMAGVLAGLILFSIFSFWFSFLFVTAIVIFLITNVARANVAELMPAINLLFHFASYALFTAVWMRCMNLFWELKSKSIRRFLVSLAAPLALLMTVKFYSVFSGRFFSKGDIIVAVTAISVVVSVNFLFACFCRRSPARTFS